MRDDESPSGQAEDTSASLLHRFDIRPKKTHAKVLFALGGFFVVSAGILTGFFLAPLGTTTGQRRDVGQEETQALKEKPKAAREDIAFRDCAEGKLEQISRDEMELVEGTHKLIRPGGPDQTAYLTSSVADLDQFVGHDVTVWGETHQSTLVGWLMDVGRVIDGKGFCSP